MTVHSFHERNECSHRYAEAPWWEQVYREAFPSYQGMVNVRDDGAGQRNGIDRHVILANGRTQTIDEKVREAEYNDFFLEYLSNSATGALGWVEKDLACDYIAYAFVQSGRCFLLPFPLLRRVWRYKGEGWKRQFPLRHARNEGYDTVGCCVPIDKVRSALAGSMLVTFDVGEEKAA